MSNCANNSCKSTSCKPLTISCSCKNACQCPQDKCFCDSSNSKKCSCPDVCKCPPGECKCDSCSNKKQCGCATFNCICEDECKCVKSNPKECASTKPKCSC